MQQKTEKNTEKLQSSSEIENINGTQRKQLEQILKYDLQHIAVFPFDDTSETYAEGIADKSKALASFKMILVENITAHQKKALKSWDTLDSVEGVRKILYHEKPEGVASAEAGGLLNLVRYDDNTAPHITPEAVVQYIQLEVERRINALLASGIKPAEFPQIDLRSAIDEIDNSDLKQVFVDNLDACKKLIDKKISSFDNLHQFGLKNASALKELLENADAAIYLIKNEYLTFKQISDFGIKESIALYFLLKNHKAYISYVERGLTTFKKLLALVTGEYIYEAFEAFGSYPEAVEKLLALGISFADLYQLGMQPGYRFQNLLENLLEDLDSEASKEWINAHSTIIKRKHLEQSDEGRYFLQLVDKMENIEKKRLCILNGALLLQFVEKNNNITVNTILKLPLDVLKNFDNSKDYKILTDVFHDIGKMVEVFLKVGECAPSKAR